MFNSIFFQLQTLGAMEPELQRSVLVVVSILWDEESSAARVLYIEMTKKCCAVTVYDCINNVRTGLARQGMAEVFMICPELPAERMQYELFRELWCMRTDALFLYDAICDLLGLYFERGFFVP
jgi:hypothetical protein